MKNPKVGDYILWRNAPAKIIGTSEGKQVIIEMLEDVKCPECGHRIGKDQFSVIISSPLFQESAEPIQTMESK